MDISGIVKGTGVALESQAFKMFGSAVENQVGGVLGQLFGVPKAGPLSPTDAAAVALRNKEPGVWDPSWYSAATASGRGNYDPRNKFLFRIKFDVYSDASAQMASSLGVDINDLAPDVSFVIKQIDLPKIDYEYQEVNMYNFRTKILKSIKNNGLSLQFYDDVGNHALQFLNIYYMMQKPMARWEPTAKQNLEDLGFAFSKAYMGADSAYRGVLPGDDSKQILRRLVIEQFYLQRSGGTTAHLSDAMLVNTFVFTNPRITHMDFGDQDHAGTGVNVLSAQFDFDALHIGTQPKKAIESITPRIAGNDIVDATEEIAARILRGSAVQQGKTQNPFLSILARQGNRLVQTVTQQALGKRLGTIAGGALQGPISMISGTLGTAAQRTLMGVNTGAFTGFSKPSVPFISDNNTPASAVKNLSTPPISSDGSGG